MFLFIIASLGLCILVQSDSAWLTMLESSYVTYLGLSIGIGSMLVAILDKNKRILAHDIFAVACLVVWFSYWRTLFKHESPFFFIFPLYFVFIGALLEFLLLGQQTKPDPETLRYMRAFARNSRIQLWLVMVVVLASLDLVEHYLLYPTAITVLLVWVALSRYLAAEGQESK